MLAVGSIYESNIGGRIERRLILDFTDQCVFYQTIYNEPEGTFVDNDYLIDQKQITMKKWRIWVKLARKVEIQ